MKKKALYTNMMIGSLIISCCWLAPVQKADAAVVYIYPEAGVFFPTDSDLDTTATIGLTAGVGLLNFLALELEYQRILEKDNTPSGNIFNAAAALRIPTGKIVPYGSVGVGFIYSDTSGSNDVDFMMPFSAGVDFGPYAIFSFGLGVEYGYVQDQSDYVLPYLRLGLTF